MEYIHKRVIISIEKDYLILFT